MHCYLYLSLQLNSTRLKPPDSLSSSSHTHYCTTSLEFNTEYSTLDIDQLPIVDVLPPLPECLQAGCSIELGPVCFRQEDSDFGGG